jgi:hypothetical protein
MTAASWSLYKAKSMYTDAIQTKPILWEPRRQDDFSGICFATTRLKPTEKTRQTTSTATTDCGITDASWAFTWLNLWILMRFR